MTDFAVAEEGGAGDGTTVEFLTALVGVAAFESMVRPFSPLGTRGSINLFKNHKKSEIIGYDPKIHVKDDLVAIYIGLN